MTITAVSAMWFLPFVLPICLYVMFTDMAQMRITNQAVAALAITFLVIGLCVLPFNTYLWRLLGLVIVLIIGIVLNAIGAMGAGDSKFLAAGAPFVPLGDLGMLTPLFMIVLVAALVAHKIAKHSPLRQLAPGWISWTQEKKFPMGLALGPTLAIYLMLGVKYGAS
jgi:prepilin peptidase CpaA